MKDLDTVVCYEHKKTGMCIDMKYIKGNEDKTLRLLEGTYRTFDKDYQVKEIPFSEDWELRIYYSRTHPRKYIRQNVQSVCCLPMFLQY